MCSLGGTSNCCPCSLGATSGPGPLSFEADHSSSLCPPSPAGQARASGGSEDLGRLSVWIGGSELRCTSHRQRPGLLLTCCWRRINNGGHHPTQALPWAPSFLCVPQLSFLSSHVPCCSSSGGEWQLHEVARTIIISICVAKP